MTDLRKAQLVMKDILDFAVKICEENNIKYWLDCGTLLGAVRHGGFIPWDDDIDIVMSREDFEKFAKIFPKYENEDYGYIDEHTDKVYHYYFSKVLSKHHFNRDKSISYNKGIYIDIFPMDFYEKKYEKKWERFMFLSLPLKKNKEKGLKGKLLYLKRQILKIEWGILKYILLKNKNKGNKDIITYDWKMADYQAKFKYNDIFPLSKVKFEGTEYNAPKDIHLYLTTIYGDYTELPPIENQICHNKEGFIFDEKYLKKWSENENIINNNCI